MSAPVWRLLFVGVDRDRAMRLVVGLAVMRRAVRERRPGSRQAPEERQQ
ncbi:MAG TPA: hypothetical protein VGE02_03760 [Gemmatimonadales bacterium]